MKAPRASGKFCKVPDGWISGEQQSKALGELWQEYQRFSEIRHHEGIAKGYLEGWNKGVTKIRGENFWAGVASGALGAAGLAIVALFILAHI